MKACEVTVVYFALQPEYRSGLGGTQGVHGKCCREVEHMARGKSPSAWRDGETPPMLSTNRLSSQSVDGLPDQTHWEFPGCSGGLSSWPVTFCMKEHVLLLKYSCPGRFFLHHPALKITADWRYTTCCNVCTVQLLRGFCHSLTLPVINTCWCCRKHRTLPVTPMSPLH